MNIADIKLGTELKLIDSNGTYIVTELNGDEISLEHKELVASMDVYLEDLPGMFEGIK